MASNGHTPTSLAGGTKLSRITDAGPALAAWRWLRANRGAFWTAGTTSWSQDTLVGGPLNVVSTWFGRDTAHPMQAAS